MKLTELKNNNSTPDTPSDLVAAYLRNELECNTLQCFLLQFDFDSVDELEYSIRLLCRSIVSDLYLTNKRTQQDLPQLRLIYKRFSDIVSKAGSCDKYPHLTATELWHGTYGRRLLNERTEKLLNGEPSDAEYMAACERIKSIYNITDTDILKITYFVQQVKAGADFPPSLRRMLYLWGEKKKTGKTTTAGMITAILNGDTFANVSKYSTTLTQEMQIRGFSVPLISTCNVAVMDECFYADMGKTYADFKRFLTSCNGRARLPYGQEFEWYGQPNYIATSNDPLKSFIKDWGDRRYLSVHFDSTPQQMDFDEIYEMWLLFCRNVPKVSDWRANTIQIEQVAEETGERSERTDEFAVELQQDAFIDSLIRRNANAQRFAAENKITLKFFVDYFAQTMGAQEANRRRGEIEKAVVQVYGERYSTSNYWLLQDLQSVAHDIRYNIEAENKIDEQTDKMPF